MALALRRIALVRRIVIATRRTGDPSAHSRWLRFALAACFAFTSTLAGLVDSTAAADTAITFSIGETVTSEDAATVIEGLTMADAFVSSTLSRRSGPLVVNIRNADVGADYPHGTVAFYQSGFMVVFTGSPGWKSLAPFGRVHVAVHEYIHAWQDAVDGQNGRALPTWFTEGMAEYLAYEAIGDLGLIDQRAVRDFHTWSVQSTPDLPALDSLESPDAFYGEHSKVYSLAFLALDQLLGGATSARLADFYRRAHFTDSWEDAFADSFGMDLSAFYRSFARYRTELIAPTTIPAAFAAIQPVTSESAVAITGALPDKESGEQLVILASTEPGAICHFALRGGDRTEWLSGSTFADPSGQVFWLITIPEELPDGAAEVTADCGGATVSAEVDITDEH